MLKPCRIMALTVALTGLAAMFALPTSAKPPMEAFAEAPAVRSPDLSPDGKTIIYLSRVNGEDFIARYDVATGKNEALARAPNARIGAIGWVGPNHVILTASKIVPGRFSIRKYEDTGAFSYNLETKTMVQLLIKTKDLFPYQTGLGNVLGVAPEDRAVYMIAYMRGRSDEPTLDVLKVDLDTGLGERSPELRGSTRTVDWVIDNKGIPIARTEYESKSELYQIQIPSAAGGWRTLYSETTKDPSIGIVGHGSAPDRLVAAVDGNSDFLQIFEMSKTDGTLSAPLRTRDDAEVQGILLGEDKTVIGVRYSGLYTRYTFFDALLDRDIRAAMGALPDASATIASRTRDWSRVLFYVEGGAQPPRYMLFDRAAKQLTQVARERPEIKPEEVGEVTTVEYKARDGLTIPALITWPVGVPTGERKNLPLIMMPHGGPETYDGVGFDWLAQFLANEGYMVMQPNFRGSGGFGKSFAEAGYGQWGRAMQNDITDGAKALFKMGWADPERACIVGWSYGGYAALAGGALTPDLYKCVVAIAGVSDLRTMLADERKQTGVKTSSYRYWLDVIGDPTKSSSAIDAVSPYRLADRFQAPVLLIHGTDDLVVSDQQSAMMERALKDAGKPVTYLRIGKDDHSLVAIDSRNKALTAIGDFVKIHIGK
jgi:dipeptidyl aminopeptidase/acylaminoacyl peptidase